MFTTTEEEISNLLSSTDGAKTICILRENVDQLEIAPQDLQQLTQATVFENRPGSMSEVNRFFTSSIYRILIPYHRKTRFMKERRAQLEKEGRRYLELI